MTLLLVVAHAGAGDQLVSPAQTAFLRVWQPDGHMQAFSLESDGSAAALVSGKARLRLPLPAERVLGFGPVPPGLLAQLRAQPSALVMLNGARSQDQRFVPQAIELAPEAEAPSGAEPGASIPLYAPALKRLEAHAFGSEQRASLSDTPSGTRQLHCGPGTQPAGLLLTGPLRGTLDRAGGGLRFQIRTQGRFGVAVSDRRLGEREEPIEVGELSASDGAATVDLTLPSGGWEPADWRSITLSCPAEGGELEISGLEVILADAAPARPLRALWVWNPAAWRVQPQELLALLRSAGAQELFLSLPLVDEDCVEGGCQVADGGVLRDFLIRAGGAGVRVWAVMGDPFAVLPVERAAWQSRVRAVAGLNRSLPATCRLAGLQFDIEPYLIPGYELHARDWNHRYLELLADLHLAAPQLAVDLVVPWWLGAPDSPASELLEALAPLVSRLTVMDYRTDPRLVRESALPFIKWAQRHQRDVRIALESGPLPDAEARRYGLAAQGELWIAVVDRQPLYVLFDQAVPGPRGLTLAARGADPIPADRTTFFARPDALWKTVEGVEAAFSATQAFAGVAIHGLDRAWY